MNLARGVQVVAGAVQPEVANVTAILADGTAVGARVIDIPALPANAFVAAVRERRAIVEVVAFDSLGLRLGADDHVFRLVRERRRRVEREGQD